MSPRRIAVLGGGIAGLAAAHRLRELAAQQNVSTAVTVLERANRVGGSIETQTGDGFVLEMGPDSMVTEKPAAVALATRLGLEDQIEPITPQFRGARVVRGGRLVPLPDDFRLFTPLSIGALIASGLFTPGGVARAAFEPLVPAKRGPDDESLESFVTRRFGREVLERLAQPLIGGIYSGDPARLSMRATLPQLLDMEQRYGSLMRGMRAAAKKAPPAAGRLVSLRDGLGSLVTALERALGNSIRTNCEVQRLQQNPAGAPCAWTVVCADGTVLEADAVICALPAFTSARLLHDADPALAQTLRDITYHSVATITLIYRTHDIPALPRCTGFVVPAVEHRKIMAATFSSQKYAHRAPEGYTVLRAFVGGAQNERMVAADDVTLIEAAAAEFKDLLAITARPETVAVRRWHDALPEYVVGHTEKIDGIERAAAKIGNFSLAGSAYRGVGIADCVRSGESAAAAVLPASP